MSNIRSNYITMPSDYIYELQQKGKRKKARAFMEYFMDMQSDAVNSISFYCKSWDVSSKGSVHKWIQEFVLEIEAHYAFWSLKNARHHTSVKNKSERKVNGSRTKNSPRSTENRDLQKNEETQSERQVNQVFNIYNNNKAANPQKDKNFLDLRFVYNINSKFVDKIEESYAEFVKIKDIDIDLLKLAAMHYLHDPQTENRRFKLNNFLKNQVYLNYMPKKMRIKIDGVWHTGVYNQDDKSFTTDKWRRTLSSERLLELYTNKELEYINPQEHAA